MRIRHRHCFAACQWNLHGAHCAGWHDTLGYGELAALLVLVLHWRLFHL